MAHSDAPSSSSVPPPPEEPTLAEQSLATAPSLYPFGLTNVAASYATALVSIHQRHAHNPIVTTPIHPHSDSSEEDEAWVGADFSGLRDPEAMRRFMIASDYCFGYSDSNGEDACGPTRECFNVKLGMPNVGDEDEGAGNRPLPHVGAGNATPPRVEPRQRGTMSSPPKSFDD